MLTAVLLIAAPIVQEPLRESPRCRPAADRARASGNEALRLRPLNEMPDARPVLTVYRQVDGCAVLLVRDKGRIVEEPVGHPELRRTFKP